MDEVTRRRREIGKRITRARLAADLSIEAARAKMPEVPSRWTWMRWESGRGPIPAELLVPIARVVQADPGWLLIGRAARALAAAA
jgi:hypothetical protein